MNSDILKAITTKAGQDFSALVEESKTDIMAAITATARESQVNEKDCVLKLGLAVSLNLDKNEMETTLSYSVRHSRSTAHPIPDPSQPDMFDVGQGTDEGSAE